MAQQVNVRYRVTDAQIGDAPVTVLAVPAYAAAGLLKNRNGSLAALLKEVQYAPMLIAAGLIVAAGAAATISGIVGLERRLLSDPVRWRMLNLSERQGDEVGDIGEQVQADDDEGAERQCQGDVSARILDFACRKR